MLTTGLEETGIVKWLKQKVVERYVQKEKLGLKELLIHILAHMQIWPHLNIAKIQTMLKDLKRKQRK